ncbi:MAG: hypothetical protein AAF328_06825 [Planctomycetota bacterium]
MPELDGDTLRLRLTPETGDRVRLPAGVVGAAVHVHVGENFPEGEAQWRLLNNMTRPRPALRWPASVGGPGRAYGAQPVGWTGSRRPGRGPSRRRNSCRYG